MIVLQKIKSIKINKLDAYCGQKWHQRCVMNGTIWTCKDWAVLVVDEKVKEVWVVKSQ